jgi:hypothetical protein
MVGSIVIVARSEQSERNEKKTKFVSAIIKILLVLSPNHLSLLFMGKKELTTPFPLRSTTTTVLFHWS